MTTYNTGNPLGSTDVYDRYDNSENLDNFSNGQLDAYPDRFGVSRQSLQGIRNASQYVKLGPYAAGLNFTSRNQVFSYGGEFYAPGPAITLPYTTTGAGAAEIANFRSVGDAVLRADLASALDGKGAALVAYPGYSSLLAKLQGGVRDFAEFKVGGASDLTAFQNAVTSGSVIVRTGTTLNITGDVSIPANRLIIVEFGALVVSNGRFTAYGVNNVHWRIDGEVRSTGMVEAPAKSGWPNTGEGTQNGNERGFIEFGGVIFGGDDGKDYSVTGCGLVSGDWTGTPNVSDIPRIVNRKGIAAWNCSRVYFSIRECYGFEGEAVYWFSRSVAGSHILFDGIYSHDHRFNALNINALAANKSITVRDCLTENSYTGLESSAGDILNCTMHTPESFGIYFGQGSGGGDRLIQGNKVVGAKDTAYSLLYLDGFEGQPRITHVKILDNLAVDAGKNAFAVKDLDALTFQGNTSIGHGMTSAGYAFGFFGIGPGLVSNNVSISPATFGTTHLTAINCKLVYQDNPLVPTSIAVAPQLIVPGDFIGGIEDSTTLPGQLKNAARMVNPSFAAGSGAEVAFYTSSTEAKWAAASVGHKLESVSAAGVKGTLVLSSRRALDGDPLLPSFEIDSAGHMAPATDALQNLGSPSKRINNSYFAVAPTVTSDESLKYDIRAVSEKELSVARKLKRLIVAYRLISEGDGGGVHFGVIAQEVVAAFEEAGLNAMDYGMICKATIEDGGGYGVRYEEMLCFMMTSL